MISNTDLNRIGKSLEEAGSVLLFPHINPDGDAIGACIALCHGLRGLGKDCWILLESPLTSFLAFMDDGLCTTDRDVILNPDVCVCVDCSEEMRFPSRVEAFHRGKLSVCLDHHVASECPWDMYVIDNHAAAACELIYRMMTLRGWPLTGPIARALYTGIVADTGCFRYSNTTPETHRIAAELIELGADVNDVSVRLYQSVDPREMNVTVSALNRMELFAGGRAAITDLSTEQRLACGAGLEHTENIIDELRNIRGVEIAAFLKEDGDAIRVSLRAKTEGNVAVIAEQFGGGGHIKAAGCTMEKPLERARSLLKEAIEKSLAD
ncbi:MAG: bifunctional oligoribonuclease/PAP phosphatase NrnA [Firmicutes bacterium]|nr:bifunctional oligoribonuclease/PAP phosphatase NrnA [Bacillota bacterium]